MYVCICNAITEQQIRDEARKTKHWCRVAFNIGLDFKCRKCVEQVRSIVDEENERKDSTSTS